VNEVAALNEERKWGNKKNAKDGNGTVVDNDSTIIVGMWCLLTTQ
jgi:hypothetical protein